MSDDVLRRRVRPSPQVVSSRMGDACVLVHLQTNRIFELNATGRRIWELLGDSRTLEEIVAILDQEFDADYDQLKDELLSLVDAMAREKLINDHDSQ